MRQSPVSQKSEMLLETTLWGLVNTIHEVSDSDVEALAVLKAILAENRIAAPSTPPLCAA